MKNIIFTVPVLISLLTVSLPTPAAALSCLAPDEYIPMIVEEGEGVIFTGEITSTSETDGQVTGLTISVSEVLQGEAAETMTVQYEYDDTWGYLCTNAPNAVGTTETFIVRPNDNESPYVTYSFEDGSYLDGILQEALTGEPVAPTPNPEPPMPEENETVKSLMFQVIELLQELLGMLRS